MFHRTKKKRENVTQTNEKKIPGLTTNELQNLQHQNGKEFGASLMSFSVFARKLVVENQLRVNGACHHFFVSVALPVSAFVYVFSLVAIRVIKSLHRQPDTCHTVAKTIFSTKVEWKKRILSLDVIFFTFSATVTAAVINFDFN